MFINNINPDLINIGPFSIRFYGLVYALGFLFISYMLDKKVKSKKIKNLTKDRASDLLVYTMIFGLLGARLVHVISDFHLYKNNLIGIFQIWNGGLAFHGGLLAIIFGYYYC